MLSKVMADYSKLNDGVLSADGDFNNWKDAVKNDQQPYKQYSDLKANKSSFVRFLQIQKIPFNILVNDKGEIIAVDSPLETLNNYL